MKEEKDELLEEELEEFLPSEEPEGYLDFPDNVFSEIEEEEEEVEEPEEEEEKEEAEEPEEEETEEESKTETKEEEKPKERGLPPEIEEILKHIPEDAEIKSKGMKIPAKALTKEEALALMNKGFRFYQAMEELAKKEKELKNRELQLDEMTQRIAVLQAKLSEGSSQTEQTVSRNIPPELQPSEYDDQTTAAIKKAAREALERAQRLEETLKSMDNKTKMAEIQAQIFREIENAVADFPLASPAEVLLFYLASQGKATPRELAALSHKRQASIEHVKNLLAHAPEIRKMLKDEIIREYLAEQKTKRVPIKSGTTKKVVAGKKENIPITFDNISQILKKKLSQAKFESEEEED